MANSSSKRLRKYLKLHWIKVTLISVVILLVLSIVILTTVGLRTFFQLDSFFRKSMLAGIPIQIFMYLIVGTVSAAISAGIFVYFIWGGGFDKLKSRKVKSKLIDVKMSEVIGMEVAKKEIKEVIQLINDRTHLSKIGGKIIKGVLMIGPPGCGKTYLAKAIATETKLPFIHASGSEFQGMFIGVGSSRVKTIFKEARVLAEIDGGCIIFIDEIDTIARPRIGGSGGRAGQDYNATVNQLLTELDGLDTDKDNIVVIAATNVSEYDLDTALMRPGRFDRKVYVGLPGLKDREQLLHFYFNKVAFDETQIDFRKLARFTVGNSPADIANVVREASLIAARKRKNKVDISDFHDAKERISIGIKSEYVLSTQDKKIAAYHESGHTIIAYLLVPTQDVFKASIVPRRQAAGVTWLAEKEERFIQDKDYLLGEIKFFLGGYAAEKMRFGSVSDGVGQDLKVVNQLVEKMVTRWGMGTSGPSGVFEGPFAPGGLAERDKEAIINDCLSEVNEILLKEKDILAEMAHRLIKEEELDYDQLEGIFKKHGKSRMTYLLDGIKRSRKDGVAWNDIIGMDEVKEEAKEMVELIKDQVKLKEAGGQIIKGLLMFGPPGCGKTYLASAMANEARLPFLTRSGSEFVEMYVGVGASRIRQLFQEAREKAMAKGGCIIFIDEIDALCSSRTLETANSERNSTLNQFLVEMDGLKEKDSRYNIVVVGATNMSEAFLDQAIMRPGRFDRKIYIDLPALKGRTELFSFYLSKVKYNKDEIDPEKFAKMTHRYSPADIANLIHEAVILLIRNKKSVIGIKEIEEARERIELGLRRNLIQTSAQLKRTAYHEIGHIMAEYFFLKKSFPFKVSIIPRRRSLGVSWKAREGDDFNGDENELRAEIKTCLGGYVAERLKFGTHETGISSDFRVAISIAERMVWKYGMGKSGFIGDISHMDYISDKMKSQLEMEIQEIFQECIKDVKEVLERESELFEHFVVQLLEKEELNYSEIEEIFNKYAKVKPEKPSA